MKEQVNELLGKELSRLDFLKIMGGMLIMLVGVQNFISLIANFNRQNTGHSIEASRHGFGASKFGE